MVKDSTGRGCGKQKIWPIEERMRADMAARGYTPMTQRIYVRGVRHLSRHYARRNPELISASLVMTTAALHPRHEKPCLHSGPAPFCPQHAPRQYRQALPSTC